MAVAEAEAEAEATAVAEAVAAAAVAGWGGVYRGCDDRIAAVTLSMLFRWRAERMATLPCASGTAGDGRALGTIWAMAAPTDRDGRMGWDGTE